MAAARPAAAAEVLLAADVGSAAADSRGKKRHHAVTSAGLGRPRDGVTAPCPWGRPSRSPG